MAIRSLTVLCKFLKLAVTPAITENIGNYYGYEDGTILATGEGVFIWHVRYIS